MCPCDVLLDLSGDAAVKHNSTCMLVPLRSSTCHERLCRREDTLDVSGRADAVVLRRRTLRNRCLFADPQELSHGTGGTNVDEPLTSKTQLAVKREHHKQNHILLNIDSRIASSPSLCMCVFKWPQHVEALRFGKMSRHSTS
jgi:hypothetical protein